MSHPKPLDVFGPTPDKIRDKANWLGRYLAVERSYDEQLKKALQEAVSNIDKKFGDLVNDNISTKLRRVQLSLAHKEIRGEINRTFGNVGNLIKDNRQDAAVAAINATLFDHRGILASVFPDSASRQQYADSLRESARRNIEAVTARVLMSERTLSQTVYGTANLANGAVSRTINNALARGDSAKNLAKDVRSLIDPNVPGGVSYAAARLGRTEINNAFHAQAIVSAQDTPWVQQMRWETSRTHKDADECDDYAAIGLFPVENVPEKPHPNCRCFVVPELQDYDSFEHALVSGQYDPYINSVMGDNYSPGFALSPISGEVEPMVRKVEWTGPPVDSPLPLSKSPKLATSLEYDWTYPTFDQNKQYLREGVQDVERNGYKQPNTKELNRIRAQIAKIPTGYSWGGNEFWGQAAQEGLRAEGREIAAMAVHSTPNGSTLYRGIEIASEDVVKLKAKTEISLSASSFSEREDWAKAFAGDKSQRNWIGWHSNDVPENAKGVLFELLPGSRTANISGELGGASPEEIAFGRFRILEVVPGQQVTNPRGWLLNEATGKYTVPDLVTYIEPTRVKIQQTSMIEANIGHALQPTPFKIEVSVGKSSGTYKFIDSAGNQMGKMNYDVLNDGSILINGLHVEEAQRSKGIATELLNRLATDFPGATIEPGPVSKDGLALFNALKKQYPDLKIGEPIILPPGRPIGRPLIPNVTHKIPDITLTPPKPKRVKWTGPKVADSLEPTIVPVRGHLSTQKQYERFVATDIERVWVSSGFDASKGAMRAGARDLEKNGYAGFPREIIDKIVKDSSVQEEDLGLYGKEIASRAIHNKPSEVELFRGMSMDEKSVAKFVEGHDISLPLSSFHEDNELAADFAKQLGWTSSDISGNVPIILRLDPGAKVADMMDENVAFGRFQIKEIIPEHMAPLPTGQPWKYGNATETLVPKTIVLQQKSLIEMPEGYKGIIPNPVRKNPIPDITFIEPEKLIDRGIDEYSVLDDVRPTSFNNAKNVSDIGDVLRNYFGVEVDEDLGFNDFDMDLDAAKGIGNKYLSLNERYSHVDITRMQNEPFIGSEYAITYPSDYGSRIEFNQKYFEPQGSLRALAENDERLRFHPVGSGEDPGGSIMAHEYAHAVDNFISRYDQQAITDDDVQEAIWNAYKKYSKNLGPTNHHVDFTKAVYPSDLSKGELVDYHDWLQLNLSGYSFKKDSWLIDRAEALAEAFDDVDRNGDAAWGGSKALQDLIDKRYNAVLKEQTKRRAVIKKQLEKKGKK